jgi:hypothetical protein
VSARFGVATLVGLLSRHAPVSCSQGFDGRVVVVFTERRLSAVSETPVAQDLGRPAIYRDARSSFEEAALQ